MWAYGNLQFRDPARAKARLRIAVVAALLSATLAVIAIKFQTQPYLTSAPANRRAGQPYSRMWFDRADNLTGAFWEGNRLIVERWPGANPARTWRFDIAIENREQVLWTVAEDGSRLAWISGSSLHIQSLRIQAMAPAATPAVSSKPVTIALPERRVLALSVLSDGSAAVSFEDSSVGRWEAGSGRALGEWRGPIHDVERAAAAGDYLAFSSIHEDKVAVYNFHGEQWIQTQTAISPEVPERIVLASSGSEATLAEGRLRAGGVTRPSPGKSDPSRRTRMTIWRPAISRISSCCRPKGNIIGWPQPRRIRSWHAAKTALRLARPRKRSCSRSDRKTV